MTTTDARPRGARTGRPGRAGPGGRRGADRCRRSGQARRDGRELPRRGLDARSAQLGLHRQGPGHLEARRRRHPGLGVGLEPPARQADGRDAERRPDRDVDGQQVAAQPPPPGRGPRPGAPGRPVQPAQAPGPAAVRDGRPAPRLFRQVPVKPARARLDHHRPLSRPGRAPARQRRDRAGEGQPLDGDGPPAPVRLPGPAPRRRARRPDRRRSRRPTRSAPRSSRRTCCSPSARRTRTCSPSSP